MRRKLLRPKQCSFFDATRRETDPIRQRRAARTWSNAATIIAVRFRGSDTSPERGERTIGSWSGGGGRSGN